MSLHLKPACPSRLSSPLALGWALSAFCLCGCAGNQDGRTGGEERSARFQGRWTAEVDGGSGRKLALWLTFKGRDRFVLEGTLTIQPEDPSKPVSESPAPTCEYEYHEIGDGKLRVTMLSKIAEGKDFIKPEDKGPQEWEYRCEGDMVSEIINPRGWGGRPYRFHKEQ